MDDELTQTLIFDLDGTISDPLLGITNCTNHAFAALGHPTFDMDDIRPWVGPPFEIMFRGLLGPLADAQVADIVTHYRARYGEVGYAENTLYDGIPQALAALVERGYRLGVCTSKKVEFAEKILVHFGLRDMFAFVDGGNVGVKKVDQLARLAAKGLGDGSVVAADAMMIGDRAVDITSAQANGIASIGVLWGFGDRAEIEGAGPDIIVERPRDLLGVF